MSSLKKYRLCRQTLIDQDTIVRFVTAIETKKDFKRDPSLIFRHMISEMGELDSEIYNLESAVKDNVQNLITVFEGRIGRELVDIIFLACYMADIFNVELNDIFSNRMKSIANQYGVPWKSTAKRGKAI